MGTLRRRLDALDASTFDLLLYNAGMDPHEGSAIGGLTGITSALLAERESTVFEWARQRALPVAFVLAGGYSGGAAVPRRARRPAPGDDRSRTGPRSCAD